MKAWENVSEQAIANCFRTCGFINYEQKIGKGISIQPEEVEGLLSTWYRLEVTVTFEEFVHFDNNVANAGSFTDEKITLLATAVQHNSDNDDKEEKKVPVISLK
jgi:hypothetical protein